MVGLVFIVIGGILLIAGIKLWIDGNRIMANGEKVQGTVIDVKREKDRSDAGPYYYPIVYFVTRDGQKISKQLDVATTQKWSKGEKVNLVYDMDHPMDVIEDTFLRRVLVPRFFTALGLLAIITGALMYLEIIELPVK